ncbi:hypothetical protein BC835DRAFT_1508394 [Cytidiella melzeri]|nr:hypothetical protein BC835DRAFT_1508394 [Cytidiella melzeri]
MLPYHKADPFYRGTLIVHLHHATASPVSLLQQYLQKRDIIHGARPALFIKEDGSFPTRAWFKRLFFRVLDRGTFEAHSARAGGATYYASIGLSENVIMALGHWSSSAWKDYIRDNPSVRAELELASIQHTQPLLSYAFVIRSSFYTTTIPLTHKIIPNS